MIVTPSGLERLSHCLGSAVLPTSSMVSESLSGASRGSAIHQHMEQLTGGLSLADSLAKVPEVWRDDCAAIPLDKLPPLTSGLAEVAMAWNVAEGTCRVLGAGLSREEARARCRPGEMPMVADWVAERDASTAILLDWKTGFQAGLSPTAENLQILTYGAVYLLATGKDEVHLYLCRPDRDRPTWDGPVVMDVLAAEAHLERVRALVEQAQSAREAFLARKVLPTLAMGPWCAWCSARFRCPAQVGALVAVVEGDAERCVDNVMELTAEQAGSLWGQLKVAEALAKNLRKKLENIARAHPIPLPSGERLAEVTETDEEMEPEAAASWLRTRYGDAVANATVRLEGTWARLEEALVAHVLPERRLAHEEGRLAGRAPSKAALVREARGGLKAARAVRWTSRQVVKPVMPQLPEGEGSSEK